MNKTSKGKDERKHTHIEKPWLDCEACIKWVKSPPPRVTPMKNSSKDREGKCKCKKPLLNHDTIHNRDYCVKCCEWIKETKPSQQEKYYCSKHGLNHGKKYKSCQPPKSSDLTTGKTTINKSASKSGKLINSRGKQQLTFEASEKQLQELAKQEVKEFNYRLRNNNKLHKQGYEDCRKAMLNDLRQIVEKNQDFISRDYNYIAIAEAVIKLIK